MNSVQEIRQRLIDSELLTPEAADEKIAQWREQASGADKEAGEALIEWLVQDNQLTEFQGDAIAAGHTGPFMLGPYRVRQRVAAGRLGTIYQAVHDELQQPVSLKIFSTTSKDKEENLARVQREVRISVELDHPNLVRSFHMGRAGDIYYIAYEDFRGETLEDRLQREGAIPFPDACRLMHDAAKGLAYLHDKGLVHRDVRPGTMWIGDNGGLKIMELGAVRDAEGLLATSDEDEGLTTSDTMIGTLDYLAPEQARDAHSADYRADIYSLGCTLYHCIAGRPPFKESNPIRQVMLHATEPAPELTEFAPDVPPQLCDIVKSMMAKDPDERFQSTQDVVWAMEQFAEEAKAAETNAEVSPEFLNWVQSPEAPVDEDRTLARTAELVGFLDWLADRDARRQKKKKHR